jgi:N-formylglutamate deformylase
MMLDWLGADHPTLPLVLTVPHSGESVPPEASWLVGLPSEVLLTDVDRFVDELYGPAYTELSLPCLVTRVHRYAADLNRFADDVDADSVLGSKNASGAFSKGFHWVVTTRGHRLMKTPITHATHEALVARYHDPFHVELEARIQSLRAKFPGKPVYHLDCHSMPSVGTGAHADQGQERPDVVISDFNGTSCSALLKDTVLEAFAMTGFKTSYNWPYQGGRITQRYGRPQEGRHTLQIELNRALYMDETTRDRLPTFEPLRQRLRAALEIVVSKLERSQAIT